MISGTQTHRAPVPGFLFSEFNVIYHNKETILVSYLL